VDPMKSSSYTNVSKYKFGGFMADPKLDNVSWFKAMNVCDNIALVGWKLELDRMKKDLSKFHEFVFIGEEYLFKRSWGIALHNYGFQKYHRNFWSLFESGVYKFLVNISSKAEPSLRFEPKAVNLHGNIVIEFLCLACGLVLALSFFLVERTCQRLNEIGSVLASLNYLAQITYGRVKLGCISIHFFLKQNVLQCRYIRTQFSLGLKLTVSMLVLVFDKCFNKMKSKYLH